MSDSDIGEVVPATELSAIGVDPYGSGFTVTLMDKGGDLRGYYLSAEKLTQVFAVIGEALKPGTLEALGCGPKSPTLDDILSGDW